MVNLNGLRETFTERGGQLYWKVSPNRRIRVGSLAGTTNGRGYRQVKVDGSIILVHRIIWAFYHDVLLPREAVIHHINGVRDDNRITNLRLVSGWENNQKPARGWCLHRDDTGQ